MKCRLRPTPTLLRHSGLEHRGLICPVCDSEAPAGVPRSASASSLAEKFFSGPGLVGKEGSEGGGLQTATLLARKRTLRDKRRPGGLQVKRRFTWPGSGLDPGVTGPRGSLGEAPVQGSEARRDREGWTACAGSDRQASRRGDTAEAIGFVCPGLESLQLAWRRTVFCARLHWPDQSDAVA